MSVVAVLVTVMGTLLVVAGGGTTANDFGHNVADIEGLGTGGLVPSGACLIMMNGNACPEGYTHYSNADGKYLLGAASAGENGGWTVVKKCTDVPGTCGTENSEGLSIRAADKASPPFFKVLICCKS